MCHLIEEQYLWGTYLTKINIIVHGIVKEQIYKFVKLEMPHSNSICLMGNSLSIYFIALNAVPYWNCGFNVNYFVFVVVYMVRAAWKCLILEVMQYSNWKTIELLNITEDVARITKKRSSKIYSILYKIQYFNLKIL